MKIKYSLFMSAAVAMLSSTAASAQVPELNVPYGYLVRQAEFKITDMYDLSRFGTNLGTARSAAMGGAFTSLGADLSSMNINPAGLGMYRGSEFGTTVSLLSTHDRNTLPGVGTTGGTRTSLGLNNIGAAFNMYEGTGRLTSFTLGIGYTKLADYNYRSRVNVARSNATILDMFDKQLNVYTSAEGHDALDGDTPWGNIDRGGAYYDEWAAVLAYKTWLIDREVDGDNYEIISVGPSADIAHRFNVLSKGSAGEYTISAGWNYSNKFYMGLSLGMVEYYNRREVDYREVYSNNNDAADLAADDMTYSQSIKTSGEGYNLKFGMIYRPIPGLRIGLAVHSPSVVSLRTTYNSEMLARYSDGSIENAWPPEQPLTEKFCTPTRILAGLSYTFGDFGILAADYEYTAYNGMRVLGDAYDGYANNNTTYAEQYRAQVKDDFRGAHAVRLGGEIRPSDNLSLRVGASYTAEGLAQSFIDDESFFDTPLPKSSLTLSAGLGYRFSPTASLDVTYIYSHVKHTLYDLYSYYYQGANSTENVSINSIDLLRTRHNLMLSLSFRF